MSKYIHRVNYYETDKMGITHHSNYMRFMEEARMNFLSEIGYPMTRLEKEGITSPSFFVRAGGVRLIAGRDGAGRSRAANVFSCGLRTVGQRSVVRERMRRCLSE